MRSSQFGSKSSSVHQGGVRVVSFSAHHGPKRKKKNQDKDWKQDVDTEGEYDDIFEQWLNGPSRTSKVGHWRPITEIKLGVHNL